MAGRGRNSWLRAWNQGATSQSAMCRVCGGGCLKLCSEEELEGMRFLCIPRSSWQGEFLMRDEVVGESGAVGLRVFSKARRSTVYFCFDDDANCHIYLL